MEEHSINFEPSTTNPPDAPVDIKEASQIDLDEHLLSIEILIARYETSVNLEIPHKSQGLPEQIASDRLKKNGPNAITPPKKTSPFKLYLEALLGLFNVLLLLAAVLSFVLYIVDSTSPSNVILGGVLVFVAFLNAFIDFYQGYRTAALLESFLSLVPPECSVVRDQTIRHAPASDVVLGDVVFIKSGDRVPADIRMFHVTELKVDNSSITGESEPQERTVNSSIQNPLEASNLAFSGTMAVNGEGYGIVVRTGDNSVLGQIAKLTIGEKTPHSQLTVEIEHFVRILAAAAVLTTVIVFAIGFAKGFKTQVVFGFAIGIFVGYVPQGLPVTVSTLLTIAAKRMADRNVLVKSLHAVETLGTITLLATDKTGTLTQNRMTVVGCWLNDEITSMVNLVEDSVLSEDTLNLTELIQCCVLCAKSKFDNSNPNIAPIDREILGDATEIGLLRFACKLVDAPALQEGTKKAFEIPFSSHTKWHLTVHQIETTGSHFVVNLKGAPERVAKMCKRIQIGDKQLPWDDEVENKFNGAYKHFASRGRRVIGFARQVLSSEEFNTGHQFKKDPTEFPMDDFVFIGLVALMDPPKHGVRKAVAALRTAGIQIVMVTGDHPLTAEAIARQIGLISGDTRLDASIKLQKALPLVGEDEYDAVAVHGESIDSFTDEDWDRILAKKEIVFARTSPKQKLEIVTRFQNKGHIVGVSGDGVNDSPALKKADLGISMNKTASDVSKEAAAMILLDDNFPSIVNGIAEGRLIFANLKKSIRYALTHLVPEVSAFVVFIIFGIPLPLNSMLTLLVDLGTELASSFSYAFEPPEGDLMLIPPRKVLCLPDLGTKAVVLRDLDISESSSSSSFNEKKKRCLPWWRRWKLKGSRPDLEAAVPSPPVAGAPEKRGILKRWWLAVAGYFKRGDTGEVLVDGDLLFWITFEGGIIEALGSFGAYLLTLAVYHVPFSNLINSAKTYWQDGAPPLLLTNNTIANDSDQILINGRAQSSFYIGIVICQLFNLWIQKHRYSYPWGWDMFKNRFTYFGMVCSVVIAAIVVYVPWINTVLFEGGPVPIAAYGPPIAAGLILYIWEVIRRFLRKQGYFGGVPKKNQNLIDLVRTTSSATGRPRLMELCSGGEKAIEAGDILTAACKLPSARFDDCH